jgi:hypothetical protein
MAMLLVLAACENVAGLNRVKESPEVWIVAPGQGEVVRQREGVIALEGGIKDEFDAAKSIQTSWILDEDLSGELELAAVVAEDGTVTGEAPGDLSLGEHRLILQAIDQDGEIGRAVGAFTVIGPEGAPVVDIYAPEEGTLVDIGDEISFRGNATDTASGPEELSFVWSSSIDGELQGAVTGGGESILITSQLSEGQHTVTLTVTDADGEVGSDTVHVTVEGLPEPPEPGDLIFSEFMVNPSVVEDHYGEWVELYNTSGNTLDISGYSFHDDGSDDWVFDASVLVGPHDYLVLCANINPALNGGVLCDGWFYRQPMGEAPPAGTGHGGGVAIANNDDELVLTSPAGVDIDVFDYNDTDSDPIEAAMSFGLDPAHMDGVENDLVTNWCVQTTILSGMSEPGTPGEPNDPC